MKTVGLTYLRKSLSICIYFSQKEPILITRRGQPVAVMIGVEGKNPEQVLRQLGVKGLVRRRRR